MIGKITVIQDDQKAVFVELAETANFKIGQEVDIKKHKRKRSLNQNSLYWAWLTWCISREGGGLIDQGHFSTDALHQDIKAWIQSTHPHQFNVEAIFSTTNLNTKEFKEYLEIVDRELMVRFFEIDTSKFWGEVEDGPFFDGITRNTSEGHARGSHPGLKYLGECPSGQRGPTVNRL